MTPQGLSNDPAGFGASLGNARRDPCCEQCGGDSEDGSDDDLGEGVALGVDALVADEAWGDDKDGDGEEDHGLVLEGVGGHVGQDAPDDQEDGKGEEGEDDLGV